MSKYDPLWKWIADNGTDRFQLSYEEIENVLGFAVDHSFLGYKKELLAYGYKVGKISLKQKSIAFEKLAMGESLLHYDNCIANLPNSVLQHFGLETYGPTLAVADRFLQKGYKNVVVLLMDGMGVNILEGNLDPDGFFRKHFVDTYYSVFPPTTVAATTSIDSGLQPIEHAWFGWDCYYPQIDKNVTTFLNVEQGTNTPAADINVARTYCGYQSVISRLQEAGVKAYYSHPFMPPFAKTFDEVLDRIAALCAEDGPKYIYAYCEEPDHTMHKEGCFCPEVVELLKNLENKVSSLCDTLEDTLFIITADHGHIDSKNAVILDYPKIMECLERMPSIEPRALNFFVKSGMEEQFVDEFKKALGDDFILYTKDEVLSKGLFGTGTPHPNAEGMIGDYLAVGVTNLTLFNTYEEARAFKGVHAGFLKEELEIPFIVVEKEK